MQDTIMSLIVEKEGMKALDNIIKKLSDKYLKGIKNRAVLKLDLDSISYLAWDKVTKNEIILMQKIAEILSKKDYAYSLYIRSDEFNKRISVYHTKVSKRIVVPSAEMIATSSMTEKMNYIFLKNIDEINCEKK